MIKKYILLFASAFFLMKLEGAALYSEEADSSATRERFMPIFRKIVQFQEFLSSPNLSTDDLEEADLNSHDKISGKKTLQASIDIDLKGAEQFLEKGEKLLEGTLAGDQFFRETLLKQRLQYLSNRKEHAIRSCEKDEFLIPTDPYCLSVMNRYKLKASLAQLNEATRRRNVQRYQFFNLLCSSMFKILRRDELSEETVKLLRASPKLWPLLKGETHDLGHPDEAGGFAIVNAYLRNQFAGNGGVDLHRPLNPLEKAAIRIENNVIFPLWEKEKLFNDAALYEAHIEKNMYFISFQGLGCPKTQGVYLELTPFESRLWEKALPYPAFLQPTSQTPEIEEAISLGPTFFDFFPFEKLDDTEEEVSVPSSLEGQTESIEGLSIVAERSGPSCSSDFIMPSGIRKFHDLIPSSSYEMKDLNKKDQSFIDSVFDIREFKKITYGDFETFWIKQGGKIIASHGGSHRLLVGPKGDSLTGTYTHGRGQTYIPKTIKYLRAALWYIGCRPSNYN
ncbi:MAG: hypothetical protein K2X28_00125 [Alphaproteobacteria bacterium]|nr:hypothetical protein [Alphaproteobacteria bacterium]